MLKDGTIAKDGLTVSLEPMALNLDMISLIMSYLSWTSDLLAMMRTCRTLHEAGEPLLLKDLYLEEYEQFLQFCDYIFEDVSRFRFLRSLTLGLQFVSVRMIDRLVAILGYAQGLEDLALLQCRTLDRRVSQAICALKNLKSADFRHLSDSMSLFMTLNSMQSQLSTLRVWFDVSVGTLNPVFAFANMAPSLRKIFVQGVHLDTQDAVYPQLKELGMHFCVDVNPVIMAHVYPNLENLVVDFVTYDRDAQKYEEFRERNRHAQELSSSRWTSLVSLSGSINSLYAFGLTCHVRNLMVEQLSLRSDTRLPDIPQLVAVVSDTKPLLLKLPISAEDPNMAYLVTVFETAQASLTHLVITLNDVFSRTDPRHALYSLLATIKPLRIVYLECWLLWHDNHILSTSSANNEHPIIARLKAFDDREFAQETAGHLPSIRNLVLRFSRWPSSFWQMDEANDGEFSMRRITKLSDSEGLRLAKTMQQV